MLNNLSVLILKKPSNKNSHTKAGQFLNSEFTEVNIFFKYWIQRYKEIIGASFRNLSFLWKNKP